VTDEQTLPSAPGARLIAGRYALLGELGRGGMGVVWRAQDQVIGRQVAIKELHLPDAEGTAVFSERVLREVRTAGRLSDPAVVTVFDVVTDGGTTYIVMELVEAPTLAELVRRYGPMPPQQVAMIGDRVLAALQAAHAAGIVHRDVKPANIMVAPDGRVKLTDFGIAHAIDDPRITTTGLVVGSPAFMAPERIEGREALATSDLWSLGATLFFAAEGTIAFERASTAATLHAIMTEVPYLTRVRGPLAAAILGLLVAKPEARLTAAQARNLFGVTTAPHTPPSGQTTVAQQGNPTKPVSSPKRRGWWIGAAALLVVGALVGGFFAGKAFSAPTPDAQKLDTVTYGLGGYLKVDSISDYDPCYNVSIGPNVIIGDDNKGSCEKSHTLEVYDIASVLSYTTNYDDKDAVAVAYPGAEAVTKLAEARCATSFRSTIVPDAKRSGLQFRALIPTEGEWARIPGDNPGQPRQAVRQFFCVLTRADGGQITGQIVTKVK